jgi:NAD(P)-dependent dehydrogenase (short-subunit alcohol dehydrogenase family)
MGQLDRKIAIITGGGSGIGKGIARAFAREGATLVLASRKEQQLEATAGELRADGATVLVVPVDVTHEAQVIALFERTISEFGRLDILVNNSGVFDGGPIEELSLATWRKVLDVNLTGPFLCSREAMKIMKPQGGGRIINIGSISQKTPRPDSLCYAVCKHGLQGMTHQLTMDGRKHGIVSSIIHPGATLSSFTTRRGRAKAGAGATPDDYVMAGEDVAKVAVLMAALPPEVNLYEGTILPNNMRSFIGRG